jgi:cytochrome c
MRGFAAGFTVVGIALISLRLGSVGAQDDASRPEFYTARVKPILETNCGKCHMVTNHRGGLNLDTRKSIMKGGKDGPVVIPGDSAGFLLVKLIRHEGPLEDPMPMPPKSNKLTDEEIAVVEQWIKAGAIMPASVKP